MAKSANKLNRLHVHVEALDPALVEMIENKKIGPKTDPKERNRILVEQFGWDLNDAKRLWCFGPESCGPNVLVDQTKGVQYLQEIKGPVLNAF